MKYTKFLFTSLGIAVLSTASFSIQAHAANCEVTIAHVNGRETHTVRYQARNGRTVTTDHAYAYDFGLSNRHSRRLESAHVSLVLPNGNMQYLGICAVK